MEDTSPNSETNPAPESGKDKRLANLKPVQPGEVRNPKGRGKGNLNVATHIRRLLMAKEVVAGENLPSFIKKGARITQLDIMILAQIKNARSGDVQSFNALMDRIEGKPVQKQVLASDPTDPLPPPARQVIILPSGQEIAFE